MCYCRLTWDVWGEAVSLEIQISLLGLFAAALFVPELFFFVAMLTADKLSKLEYSFFLLQPILTLTRLSPFP